jgi:hypothetical protein
MREQDDRCYPIQEDMRFQRRSWMVERTAWTVFGLVSLVALTGLFGGGALSTVTARSADGALSVTYDRFQRQTRVTQFTFHMAVTDADPRLRVGPDFLDRYELTSLQPAPVASSAGRDGVEYTFARPRGGELNVVLWAHPRRFGRVALEAQAGRDDPVRLPILVYP